ncbi:MAG TPA: hypothetical protein VFN10_21275 [Thermoanaerobaculia bacterium]|nr:hypothetical protein [Thermoanaerobaculia bacterium]
MSEKRFVVCIEAGEYEGELEPRKIYEVLDEADLDPKDFIRVVDESGEDYLYPREWFLPIDVPAKVEEALVALAQR